MLGIAFRKRLDNLLCRPFGSRMFRDPKVKDPPPLMLNYEEHEQCPQADCRHSEEIDRNHLLDVILQECSPGL